MKVSIVSAESEVWRGEADMVIARSPEGEFAILRGHIPFLAALVPSVVTVVDGSDRRSWLVPGGFLESSGPADDYHVIVLADDAEESGELEPDEIARRIEALKKKRLEEEEEADKEGAALIASMAAAERASGEFSSPT